MQVCYNIPMPINVNVLQSTYAHKCKCVTKYLCSQMYMSHKIPTPTNVHALQSTYAHKRLNQMDYCHWTMPFSPGSPEPHQWQTPGPWEQRPGPPSGRTRRLHCQTWADCCWARAGCRWWWSVTLLPFPGWLRSERWWWPAGSEWLCHCTVLCSFLGCWSVRKKFCEPLERSNMTMTGNTYYYCSWGWGWGRGWPEENSYYKPRKENYLHTVASVVRRSAPRKCGATSDKLTELDVYESTLYTLLIWVTMPLETASSAQHIKNTNTSTGTVELMN